jgi:ankyrin repeat protein
MTKFLIEKGLDVNTRFVLDRTLTPPGVGDVVVTPLHAALADGSVGTPRLLIAHGADVHAQDSIGRTPLTVAITYYPSAIELLLASGVDINEQTRFGAPLLAAARYQWLYRGTRSRQARENAVKILLEKGADPNTRDSDGRNALMVMSMEFRPVDPNLMRRRTPVAAHGGVISGNIFLVMGENNGALQLIGETLLQAGCDVNAADTNGRTPLMYAVRYRRPTAVRLLLEHGANVNARDKGGMTSLDLAKQFGNQEIISMLRHAGALPGAPKKPGAGPVKPAA